MRWPRREEEIQRLVKQAEEKEKREAAEERALDHQDRAEISRYLRRLFLHQKAKDRHRNAQKKQCCSAKNMRQWLTVAAVIGACIFAGRQWSVMQGQLNEMVAARKTTIAQIRASLRWTDPQITPFDSSNIPASVGEVISYWEISPGWTNGGSTDAIDYAAWFDIAPIPTPKHVLTESDCPQPKQPEQRSPGLVVHAGKGMTELAKKLSSADAASAVQGTNVILLVGHMEYRDIFPDTEMHSADWCITLLPIDLKNNRWSMPIVSFREK